MISTLPHIGRPFSVSSPEKIAEMRLLAGLGYRHIEIAARLGMRRNLVTKHLTHGKAEQAPEWMEMIGDALSAARGGRPVAAAHLLRGAAAMLEQLHSSMGDPR
ncbi:MAG: hypothetical protein WC378_14670 [Opitutaceae bacterium]|jgi:hypothetical protein